MLNYTGAACLVVLCDVVCQINPTHRDRASPAASFPIIRFHTAVLAFTAELQWLEH